MVLALVLPKTGAKALLTKRLGLHLLRAVLLIATSILGLFALTMLPLGEVAGLSFIAPLMTVVLAAIFLGDSMTRIQVLCMVVGSVGVMLIGQLGGSPNWIGVLLVMSAAFCFSLYQIGTKKLVKTESHVSLLVYPALLASVGLAIFALFGLDINMLSFDHL